MKLIKRDDKVFLLLQEISKQLCNASELLLDLFQSYTDVESKIALIASIESQCDFMIHEIDKILSSKKLITVDKEKAHVLAHALDEVVDKIEATAQRVIMFNVKEVRYEAGQMSRLIVKATYKMKDVVDDIKDLKANTQVLGRIIEINKYESEGDQAFREAITNLFNTDEDAKDVIVWKEIFEYVEEVLDLLEDAADIVETFILKENG